MRRPSPTRSAVVRHAAAATALMLAACAAPTPPAPRASLWDRLGGRPEVDAIVIDAIGRIATDTRIRSRFATLSTSPAAATKLKDNLVDLVCERSGGPCVYRGQNMADAHEGMQIRDEEFDALVQDIDLAMQHRRVPDAERREAIGQLEKMRGATVGH